MAKRKFAFMMMGGDYNPEKHQDCFELDDLSSYIFTVRDFEEARQKVKWMQEQGFGAMELCGAFSEEQAKELMELSGHQIATGFMTHLPEHDPLFDQFFS